MTAEQKLADGSVALGLELSSLVLQRLMQYLDLLVRWNKIHNLTAVRDRDDMVTLHLLDSLALLPYINAQRLLDVGSGGGLPGIPIALTHPEIQVTVLDSSQKKTTFLRQVKLDMGLDNLEIVCSRVEDYKPENPYELIVSRAFSDLKLFIKLTHHLLTPQAAWLAMKGVYPRDEIAALNNIAVDVRAINVPGLDAQRHLVLMKVQNK